MVKNPAMPLWATGPGEILKHGLELLTKDTDTNRRLAMISIDNAVELMIKTYLGLPERITKLHISRKEYEEFSESFPKLLDALDKYTSSKLLGIDLGGIEWFHRLRNQLYHEGNGLTVERDKVVVYAEIANRLFQNLFGVPLITPEDTPAKFLGNFMEAWIEFEQAIVNISARFASQEQPRMLLDATRVLLQQGLISRTEMAEIDHLRMIRNEVVHGITNYESALRPSMVDSLKELTTKIKERAGE